MPIYLDAIRDLVERLRRMESGLFVPNPLTTLREAADELEAARSVIAHAKSHEDCDIGLQIALEEYRRVVGEARR